MMNKVRQIPTLDRPTTYQIQVPGELDGSWSDWVGSLTIAVESEGDGPPVTTLTGTLDQAALQSVLRRLYSLSLNTVKAHTRNIYGKLDLHNRTQAVTMARALGILPST